ncbi:site-specific DNA-methyltransferase [Janthinobacterium sp. 17J80-10]|uniref:site-specific DNA-methyltransferase n=1 Tax=Janthinobacterium sp. 17J80-10 TaxID=2497863 RepID=UPI001F5146A9|nr:site-specific DNA-methyltransferase [Janthinobacterium sp. 17J80-10]
MKDNEMQKIDIDSPEAQSANLVAGNIEQLKSLFPELITEGPNGVSVNVDVLKSLVGDQAVTDADEKYGLNWHGKRRARQMALSPSTGTLRPCPEESVDWDSTKNLMIEGENLEVLKLLQKSYCGKVKLIFIDPPYNTGRDFVYPDNFQDNIKNYLELTGQLEGGKKISSNTDASGRFHTDWLNMMYPRLKLAKNMLHSRGAIFISLDDTEVANARSMCDEIFGAENFLASIVWEKVHTRKNSAKTFSISHDYVLAYAKDILQWDRTLLPRDDTSAYQNPDNDPKGPWKPDPVTAHNAYSADYKITKPNGVVLSRPSGRFWAFSEDSINSKIAANEIIWGNGDAYPMIKRYLSEVQDGLVPITIFSRKFAGDTAEAKREIDELFKAQGIFDYPKPCLLIQRLIQISSRPGDIVMDFFSGSGTTGHAVFAQNVIDDGGRRFILVQLPEPLNPDNAEQKAAADYCDKLNRPRKITELTKERLRRAASKIRDENPMFAGDTGFRVFKLDHSNIRAWNPNPADLAASLFDHQDHLLEGRSEGDVLYELLLKLGLDLCVPIERRTIAGCGVHSIGGGVLMACLAEKITREQVESLSQGILDWHKELAPAGETTCVFRDSSFADDVGKTNLTAILAQHGVQNVRSL